MNVPVNAKHRHFQLKLLHTCNNVHLNLSHTLVNVIIIMKFNLTEVTSLFSPVNILLYNADVYHSLTSCNNVETCWTIKLLLDRSVALTALLPVPFYY